MNKINEPLHESWKVAQELATYHCKGCGWYHGLWQYLRNIGMGKTLSGQSDWFLSQIQRHRGTSASVLISGCADYSAFAHAAEGLGLTGDEKNKGRIVAVDRCRTPLELNNYLSSKIGVPVTNHQEDILAFESDEKFDLIFTSSFLGFFNPTQRVLLFKKYLSLLAPGGELVFANRMKDGPENERVNFSANVANQAVHGALELNRITNLPDKMSQDAFEERMRVYVGSWGTFPLNSAASLSATLLEAGFTDFTIEERQPKLPQEKVTVAGHTFAEKTPFLCVVAKRPLD